MTDLVYNQFYALYPLLPDTKIFKYDDYLKDVKASFDWNLLICNL